MSKRIFLAAALLTAPTFAWAEPPNLYWGVSLGEYRSAKEATDNGRTNHTTDLGLRLGYHFSDFIGVEARAGFDASDVTSGSSVNSNAEYAAVFGRFDLPFEKTNIYLLAGVSEIRIDKDDVDSDEFDPIAGGLGIELYGSERTAVTLEYMSYSEDAHSGWSLGIKHHFNMPSFR